MYAESTRPNAKRDVQKFRSAQRDDRVLRSAKRDDRVLRSAKRDDRIARPRRAQTCERSELRAMRMSSQCKTWLISSLDDIESPLERTNQSSSA